jgi:hypothetical protein
VQRSGTAMLQIADPRERYLNTCPGDNEDD